MGDTNGKKPLRIIHFRSENIKAIKAITINPDPSAAVIPLTGKNRQGKSSVLDAIFMALGGKNCIPSKPIRAGAKEALVQIDLGEYQVTRKITEKGEYLEVVTKDGFKAPKPQQFLSSRLGDRAQNPLEFMRLSPGEQVKALQGLVDITLDRKEVEHITGLSTEGMEITDPIMLLDDAYKILYDRRADQNKEVSRLSGVVKSIQIPANMKSAQRVSATDLLEKRKALEVVKASNDRMRTELFQVRQSGERLKEALGNKAKEIEGLEQKVLALKAEQANLSRDYERLKNEYRIKATEVEALQDPDFTEIEERIRTSDEINGLAALFEQRTAAEADLEAARTISAVLTERLLTLKEYKTDLIAKAGLPVEGLGFEGGEITFGGIPLSQASGREQIEISCAICAARNPAIGILAIDIGWNELDADGKKVLEEFAAERGIQIWCTSVQEEPGSTGFHIYDGSVVAISGVAVEAETPKATPIMDDPDDPFAAAIQGERA